MCVVSQLSKGVSPWRPRRSPPRKLLRRSPRRKPPRRSNGGSCSGHQQEQAFRALEDAPASPTTTTSVRNVARGIYREGSASDTPQGVPPTVDTSRAEMQPGRASGAGRGECRRPAPATERRGQVARWEMRRRSPKNLRPALVQAKAGPQTFGVVCVSPADQPVDRVILSIGPGCSRGTFRFFSWACRFRAIARPLVSFALTRLKYFNIIAKLQLLQRSPSRL